jgi:putative spermidine/putrescine transport system substrate-binding protein
LAEDQAEIRRRGWAKAGKEPVMTGDIRTRAKGPTRRKVMKAAAAGAGVALGSGLVRGFPTIWAQNLKDITLLHVGESYSAIKEIGEQASKELGFKVEIQVTDSNTHLNRLLTQPKTIDINDMESFDIIRLQGRKVLAPVPVSKFKLYDKVVPIFTKGEYPDGRQVSRQGVSPFSVQYWADKDGTKLAKYQATDWLTGVPMIYNADTLGIRPDLIGRKVTQWKELLNPAFKGKTALVDAPSIGIMDVAMALESRGDLKYGDKGNMTKAEIDKTIGIMTELKKNGHFRAFWTNFDQSVNLMASGEVVIQSMWSPAVTAVRSRNIPCYYAPLKEGYRGWSSLLSPMAHLTGLKADCAMEYLNWYNSGWQGGFIAKQGYYSAVPETARKFMSPAEWDYWYEGKPAAVEIHDPYGNLMEKKGVTRDGGSFWDRMGNVACWNTLMEEDKYLTRRWNEFISA